MRAEGLAADLAAGDVVTSLVLYGDLNQGTATASTSEVPRLESCPRRIGWYLVSLSTGAIYPMRCGAHYCPFCGPMNAWQTAAAIALARPARRFDLTLVGDRWCDVQSHIRQFRRGLRRLGYRWEDAYSVEPNPADTGHHLHGHQHGDYVPQDVLSEVAQRAGMGARVFIQACKGSGDGYGLKTLIGARYGLKTMEEAEEEVAAFLAINGGRPVHSTRGFFRDAEGRGVTLVEARKLACQRSDGDPGPWQVRTPATAAA